MKSEKKEHSDFFFQNAKKAGERSLKKSIFDSRIFFSLAFKKQPAH